MPLIAAGKEEASSGQEGGLAAIWGGQDVFVRLKVTLRQEGSQRREGERERLHQILESSERSAEKFFRLSLSSPFHPSVSPSSLHPAAD